MTSEFKMAINPGNPAVPLLEVSHLSKAFPVRGGLLGRTIAHVQAVDDVSFVLHAGQVLAVVGESGSGKSTVAQLLMHLVLRDRGSIHLDGAPISAKGGISVRQLRRAMQIVFQDSYSALNPRLTVFETLVYGPRTNGASATLRRCRLKSCSTRSGSTLRGLPPAIRTSCPADNASASTSHARFHSIHGS